jgi:hypothetical protein
MHFDCRNDRDFHFYPWKNCGLLIAFLHCVLDICLTNGIDPETLIMTATLIGE